MAIQSNIQTNAWAKKCARARYFGKYRSFSDVIGTAVQDEKKDDDIPYLDFLMDDLDQLNQELTDLRMFEDDNNVLQPRPYVVRSYKDGLLIVIVYDFEANNRKLSALFEANPSNAGSTVFDKVKTFAGLNPYFAADANLFTRANPNDPGPDYLNGYVYSNGAREVVAKSIIPIYKNTISMSFDKNAPQFNRFKFKFSKHSTEDGLTTEIENEQPTEGDGFGGLTPVIFTDGTGTTVYGLEDDPNSTPKIVKNNNYADVLNISKPPPGGDRPFLGFQLFAHQNNGGSNPNLKDSICLVIHQDGTPIGSTIDPFRNRLFELGYQNVVGMDGSGSVFFYDYCKKKYIIDITPFYRAGYMFTAYAISE